MESGQDDGSPGSAASRPRSRRGVAESTSTVVRASSRSVRPVLCCAPYVGLVALTTLKTVGHGTLPVGTFASLLDGVNVERVADIRSFPGSRHNPQFGREEMERWAPTAGLGYVWMRELGGRRRPVAGSKHVALRHDAFRAYADYMETPAFLAGVVELLALADSEATAVMCSESVWWRCHRRLLADHLVLVRGINVVHVMHDGRLTGHVPTDGVRLAEGALVYDVGTTPPLSVD
jgi:uncharacterized protein (DUF488 family)